MGLPSNITGIIGKSIIRNGLSLYLDAGNNNSYSGSGANWIDLSGKGNNGTLTNGITFNSDNGGNLVFSELNHLVSTPLNNLGCNNTTQIVWYKWNTMNQTGVMTYIGNTSINGMGLYINSGANNSTPGNKVSVLYGGLFFNAINSGTLFATLTNNWTQLTLTRDAQTTKLYQNGVFLGSTIRVPRGTTLLNFSVGALTAAKGAYSQVQFYNRALSSQEILQNYNTSKSRYL